MPAKLFLKRFNQRPVLIVDGTFSAEVAIMFRDFEQPFLWYIPAASDVLEKRHYIFGPLRAAEGNYQQSLVRLTDG